MTDATRQRQRETFFMGARYVRRYGLRYSFISQVAAFASPSIASVLGFQWIFLPVRTAMRDVMTLMGGLYQRMKLDVRLTGEGVVMSSRMTLAD